MNEKHIYETPVLELIVFQAEDIVTASLNSGFAGEDDSLVI